MAMLFDTLEASRQLQEAGFEKTQADALVTTFSRNMVENVATKDDLAVLEQRLTVRFGAMVASATALILAATAIATAILLAAG